MKHVPQYELSLKLAEYFNENLSGSGFDVDWLEAADKRKAGIIGSFHAMNEAGYYDGWVDIRVRFPAKDLMKFQLLILNHESRMVARKYCLKEYIEDSIAETIRKYTEAENGQEG